MTTITVSQSVQPAAHASTLLWRLLLVAFLLIGSGAGHSAPTLEARLDRTAVSAGDSLTLSLRLNDNTDDRPDLRPLQKDFSILAQNSSSGLSAGTGGIRAWTEWHVTLLPLRSGTLTIPAIAIGGARSEPIAVRVQPARDGAADVAGEPVALEVETDRDTVYVQQQLLLKVRVLHAVPLDDMNLSEPEFENASVRKLGQEDFQRDIDGVTYQVHELTYAIFPQQAGELTVPELVFTAAELRRRRSLFDPGQPVRKLSRQISVQVKPVPPQFTGKLWLPARNLTLQETWGGNPEDIAAGSSITRMIAVQADGLMAAQLPDLDLPTLPHARLYADQPALDDQADASGMHGVRKEGAALIPARAGPLPLPEVRVVWWDLDSDSEKVATIPAQTLTIKAGAVAPATATAPLDPATAPAHSATSVDSTAAAPTMTSPAAVNVWTIATAVLGAAWLITLGLYWRLRRYRPQPAAELQPIAKPVNDAFPALINACRNDNAPAAAAALSAWIRSTYPHTPTVAQWLAQLPDDTATRALRDAIETLQRQLYREPETRWRGETLAAALGAWRKRKTIGQSDDALPALYPSS